MHCQISAPGHVKPFLYNSEMINVYGVEVEFDDEGGWVGGGAGREAIGGFVGEVVAVGGMGQVNDMAAVFVLQVTV